MKRKKLFTSFQEHKIISLWIIVDQVFSNPRDMILNEGDVKMDFTMPALKAPMSWVRDEIKTKLIAWGFKGKVR